MKLNYLQMKTTIFLGILWLSIVDVDAKRQGRRKNRGKGRKPFDGLLLSHAQTRNFEVKNPIQFGGTSIPRMKISRKDMAKISDTIRPQKGKNNFVLTKRKHLKKEWCKTQHFKQVVREPGCVSRTIVNNFCYGQCNSFFIPNSDKQDIKEASFVSCGFCKPTKFSTMRVTLICPGKRFRRLKRKRVVKIKKCRCIAQKVDIQQ